MSGSAVRPATSRKRLTSAQRRDQITDSARRVFVSQGLRGARTKDIAAEAGINEALLYHHFASKEELFEAAVVEPLDRAVANLLLVSGDPPAGHVSSQEEMVERSRLFMVDLVTVMQEVAPLLGVLIFGDEETAVEHYRGRVEPLLEQIADVVRRNLAWWVHRPFDPDRVVRIVFGGIWFEATAARLTGRDPAVDDVAAELSSALMFGLAGRRDE